MSTTDKSIQRLQAASRLWIYLVETIADIIPHLVYASLNAVDWCFWYLLEDTCTIFDGNRNPGSYWQQHSTVGSVQSIPWVTRSLGRYWRIAKISAVYKLTRTISTGRTAIESRSMLSFSEYGWKNDPSYLFEARGFLFNGERDYWQPTRPYFLTCELLSWLLCYAIFDQMSYSIYSALASQHKLLSISAATILFSKGDSNRNRNYILYLWCKTEIIDLDLEVINLEGLLGSHLLELWR